MVTSFEEQRTLNSYCFSRLDSKMEDWQEQVIIEHRDLEAKIKKLKKEIYVHSDNLLKSQLIAMSEYARILKKRIAKF